MRSSPPQRTAPPRTDALALSDLAQAVASADTSLEGRLFDDIVGLLCRAARSSADVEPVLRAEAQRLWARLSTLLQRDGRGATLRDARDRIRAAVAARGPSGSSR